MAGDEENVPIDEAVRSSVRRTVVNGLAWLVVIALLAGWFSFGAFTLEPGQSAVLLRFGRYAGTIDQPGFHLTLPPPVQERIVVNVSEVASQDFGVRGGTDATADKSQLLEATMQTSDNNIVRLSFAVQYRLADGFAARYRVADPVAVLRDASQAAMREVVGRMTIDGVLSEQRGEAKLEASRVLQEILDSYQSGIEVQDVQLQEVQPPPEVRAAFDDVIAAAQDASRKVNEAEGYENEVIPNARAQAAEAVAAAEGYRESKIAEATGASERFKAVAAEYRKAPVVTEKRLYLETMQEILPDVEKIIIEPGTASVLPYLPIGRTGPGGAQ